MYGKQVFDYLINDGGECTNLSNFFYSNRLLSSFMADEMSWIKITTTDEHIHDNIGGNKFEL